MCGGIRLSFLELLKRLFHMQVIPVDPWLSELGYPFHLIRYWTLHPLPCRLASKICSTLYSSSPLIRLGVLRSSVTFCSTWAGWLRLHHLARCTWSLHFRYSVRADGSLVYGWYRVARAWEISQAYKVFRGDLYVLHFKTRLTRELRPKV